MLHLKESLVKMVKEMTKSKENSTESRNLELHEEQVASDLIWVTIAAPVTEGREGNDSIKIKISLEAKLSDVRQYVYESALEFGFYTCFSLGVEGKRYYDETPLVELGLEEGKDSEGETFKSVVLQVIPDFYTPREVSIHLQRFREVMTNFKCSTNVTYNHGISYFSQVVNTGNSPSLGDTDKNNIYLDTIPLAENIVCLKSIKLSCWNPVSSIGRAPNDTTFFRRDSLLN